MQSPALVALALVAAVASCRSPRSAEPNPSLTPRADSLLTCAEQELFAHGYRVRRVLENPLRLRAEPQLSVNSARPMTIMVEYDRETQGLDIWAPAGRATPGSLDSSAEVTQVAWAVEDACTGKRARP